MLRGLLLLIMAGGLMGQAGDSNKKAQSKPEIVPITDEHHHQLVLDNDYVRVFHVEVAPHSETKYHQHDMDYVFVTLGDSRVASERVGEKPVKLELKGGDTRFTKGGFAHKAVNLSDKPFLNVTVELKKHYDTPIRYCADSAGATCVRDIRMGSGSIGETTSLFSNGFVTAMRHHLLPGGSLISSYYSSHGNDEVLLVALTDLKARLGTIEESLKAGQVDFTGAGE